MAVFFHGTKEEYAIGGQDGRPFPSYSISAETQSSGDGSQLGIKYNIRISGQIAIGGTMEINDDGVLQNKGSKQSDMHAIVLELLGQIESEDNIGILEIVPYGGNPNPIVYKNARLTSIEIPEQSEESAGLVYTEYTFVFEAFNDDIFPFSLTSTEESWEISLDESNYTYDGIPDWDSDVYKVYIVTHRVSATGRKKYNEGEITNDGDAWKQAKLFVDTRAGSPNDSFNSSHFGQSGTPFDASLFGLNTSDYSYYNHTRVPTVDIGTGSYSIVDTWTASLVPASVNLEVTSELNESGITNVVLNGTVQGFNERDSSDNITEKIENANSVFDYIDSNAFSIVSKAIEHSRGPCDNDINDLVVTRSIGRNKNTGLITFNYTFNNSYFPPELMDDNKPSVISFSINTSYENEDNDYKVNTIAIIPLIFKPDGPEIQNMGTTPEKRRTVQIDAVMDRCNRAVKPIDRFKPILNRYRPGTVEEKVYVESFIENWNEMTGSYSVSATWVY